ncbi:hypothetical protein F5B22DRAFT_641084 [Xylaria bambusicola]|uniref:uncharacterized protein n=1 Tax=Xylaria bambusicola TaxID=326684 RepID=UPI002008B0C9|nr:uncharacterized protein F5B22DRAFT_641084 [Xylaria bambusicola]KAI0528111.1 hypothetical protein F5B22DRAFT_641084 [Xylaria bambusicola]
MPQNSTNDIEIRAEDIARLLDKAKKLIAKKWSRMSKRWQLTGCLAILLVITGIIVMSNIHHVSIPHLRLEYDQNQSSSSENPIPALSSTIPSSFSPQNAPFNASKVALLIENRALPNLAPLLLHFIAVVPPDWRFRFMGSSESVSSLNASHAVRSQVATGKLDLTFIPTNMSTSGGEMISRFLTNLWVYETLLHPAEWLLVFQSDSILCANSRQNLNDFLEYDWVGAPWNPNGRFGGNGGLSLRRVSAIIEVLRNQVRVDGSEPEDVWLTERLGHRPGSRMANGSLSLTFSGEMNQGEQVQAHRPVSTAVSTGTSSPSATSMEEDYYIEGVDDWRDGFYEPMGYHTGSSGTMLHAGVWGDPRLRRHIWDYCPEVKMTLAMDAAKYVPGDCNASWKRGNGGINGDPMGVEDLGYDNEEIDPYPMLPPNLVPW